MPTKTNTDRIADTEKEIVRLSTDFNNLVERLRSVEDSLREQNRSLTATVGRLELAALQMESRLHDLEEFTPSRAKVLEQRVIHLEKLLDEGRTRRWQVWLAVLGAIFSAIIALIVALIKT